MDKPDIAILLPDLRFGGAERLHIELAREWVRRGHNVTFILCSLRGELLEMIPVGVHTHDLSAPRMRNVLFPLIKYLVTAQPRTLIAAMWPLTFIAPLAAILARYGGRVIISEHEPLSFAYLDNSALHRFALRATAFIGYRLATCRVAVSIGVAADLARLSHMNIESFTVIYNAACVGRVLKRGEGSLPIPTSSGPLILSVGTFSPMKKHELLIRSFAKLAVPGVRLCILGEGRLREYLEDLISKLKLHGKVVLPGYQSNTAIWYANSDLFVLTSEYEGFGNVIVEALEQGTPVVSTDCPYGPREILEGGKFGTLVPVGDLETLTKAIEEALTSQHDREALKRRAQDFNVVKAADAYLNVLFYGQQ